MLSRERVRGARLRLEESGREDEGTARGSRAGGEELSTCGPRFEGFGGTPRRQPRRPIRSRNHLGWWKRAHGRVTVPLVIDSNVPGSAAVER